MLLVEKNALLVVDLDLDLVDCVGRLDFKSYRLAHEGLDEDLHANAETEDNLEGGLLLNIVIRKGAAVLALNHLIEDIVSGRVDDPMMTDKCDGSYSESPGPPQ